MPLNILFVMFDQLRYDYLSCAGHPTLHTPNIDSLAERGVRFTESYVQSPICGASRMSTYTGRYVNSHGAQWNGVPLRVGEQTMGDHLRAAGMQCWLVGKTHMQADAEGMQRLGLSPDSIIGARQSECGFDVWCRDDGLWGQGTQGAYDNKRSPYNEYLKSRGYAGTNPWADFANAGIKEGQTASGWFMMNSDQPANIREQDSETPWLTSRAIDFIDHARTDSAMGPWCCHVSYIKPHWPYIVPEPYSSMYGPEHVPPALRHQAERQNPHPVYERFMDSQVCRAFQQDEVREKVIPAYMGLIKQADDQMGRLFDYLDSTGQTNDTIVVITSDHGDYLGDHWMGEKDLFHAPSVKVPLIIADPRSNADATRGTCCNALVESIDLCATFIEIAGGEIPTHIVEGRSLQPFINGDTPASWRNAAFSEYDYSLLPIRSELGLASSDARLFMVTDGRWKLIHARGGFRPMLFDLQEDPHEFYDLGASDEHKKIIAKMYDHLHHWSLRMAQRVTVSDTWEAFDQDPEATGILVGIVKPEEVRSETAELYNSKPVSNYVPQIPPKK